METPSSDPCVGVEPAPPLAAEPADALGLVGSVVDGRYLIERVVGSGGFSVVYRAVHLRFDSPVAIKVFRVARAVGDAGRAGFIELFLAEGKLLFELGALHPSIVRVFEAGTMIVDGLPTPYLAMEWLDGESLDRELRRRRDGAAALSVIDVIALLESCVQGLALAHRNGIAHRDIKPGNIFLTYRNGELAPKLLDFGLAKVACDSASTSRALEDSDALGSWCTPAYAAPEQWLRRLGPTGPWTDVYALALVCVELMCGRRALPGHDSAQLMAACLDESLRPTPRACGIAASDDVEAVFRTALQIEPSRRYAEVAGFWRALRGAALGSSAADFDADRQPHGAFRMVLPNAHDPGDPVAADATTAAPSRREEPAAAPRSGPGAVTPTPLHHNRDAVFGRALAIVAIAIALLVPRRSGEPVHAQPDALARSDIQSDRAPPSILRSAPSDPLASDLLRVDSTPRPPVRTELFHTAASPSPPAPARRKRSSVDIIRAARAVQRPPAATEDRSISAEPGTKDAWSPDPLLNHHALWHRK
jgi:eukaryotic-like serine/threonine-protein kinase